MPLLRVATGPQAVTETDSYQVFQHVLPASGLLQDWESGGDRH